MYKVKVTDTIKNADKITTDGYLKFLDTNCPSLYTRGEAIKKAGSFGGKIENNNDTFVMEVRSVTKVSKDQMSIAIRGLLIGKEIYSNKKSQVYNKSVFLQVYNDLIDMESEDFQAMDSILNDLVMLAQVFDTDYVELF